MPYIGKKPADIIATAVDTTTGTFSGAVSASSVDADGGVTVDNITIDGTEIDLSSGDLTLDAAGDIILDADGSDISLRDGGTEFGRLSIASSGLQIFSPASDADIFLKGNDGGSTVTALTLDMSDAGKATFNSDIVFGDGHSIGNQASSDNLLIKSSSGENIGYDSANGAHIFYNDGTENFRVNDDGEVRVTDNILLTASGKGIYLGVTSATSANLLDDYEEGTWTPSLEASSVDPTVSYTSNRSGSYIKVGDVVHVMGRVNTSSVSGGSGTALITGLPFATGAERNAAAVGYISQVSNSSGYTTTGLNPDASASSMRIVQSGSGVGGATVAIGSIGNGFDVTFSHTYKV